MIRESIGDMKKKISHKISEKTKTVDEARKQLCSYLVTKVDASVSDTVCDLVDNLCLQFESLGMLKGELHMSSIMESMCEEKHQEIVREHVKPYF